MNFPRPRLTAICLAAIAVAGLAAQAQTPATTATDRAAQRGLGYAREACAECHSVEPGVPSMPGAKAPSFTAIATTPGMTSMALNVWFSTSHPNMPNLIIPEPTQDDLFAYFAALRSAARAVDAAD